jgi:hypothetical protein
VYFVGDSLSYLMAQSFWMLLDTSHSNKNGPGDQMPGFRAKFQCGSSNMILQYTRNDILSLQMTLPVQVQWKSNVHENPWAETLPANRHPGSNGTLWVLNAGAHIHNTSEYQGFIDTLIEQWYPTAAIEHPGDLFFFRTTVPGHANCSLHSKPFRTLRDYAESIKTGAEWIQRHRDWVFGWDLFAGFNQYVSQRVKGTTIQLLDVNPMTVLRPDGHRPPTDCLHYYLPGVVDWWNHLLVTQLVRPTFGGSAANELRPKIRRPET